MKVVELIVVLALTLSLALLMAVALDYVVPGSDVRDVAEFYLYAAYNPFHLSNYTAKTPAAVTAIIWDFRGLDTLFETAVFYLALIGSLALSRGLLGRQPRTASPGLSVIVKSVTKITGPMIIAVGASIALHGHLTPGGGFQGGSVIAIVPMLFIVVFSIAFLLERGLAADKMVILMGAGLIGIGLTAIAPFVVGLLSGQRAYVFQNMAKPDAPLSMPSEVGGIHIGGTPWFFDIFEMIAVAAGFSVAFIAAILSRFEGE